MVMSAPIFISSSIGPCGITAVAKNNAKTRPIVAVQPTTYANGTLTVSDKSIVNANLSHALPAP